MFLANTQQSILFLLALNCVLAFFWYVCQLYKACLVTFRYKATDLPMGHRIGITVSRNIGTWLLTGAVLPVWKVSRSLSFPAHTICAGIYRLTLMTSRSCIPMDLFGAVKLFDMMGLDAV